MCGTFVSSLNTGLLAYLPRDPLSTPSMITQPTIISIFIFQTFIINNPPFAINKCTSTIHIYTQLILVNIIVTTDRTSVSRRKKDQKDQKKPLPPHKIVSYIYTELICCTGFFLYISPALLYDTKGTSSPV